MKCPVYKETGGGEPQHAAPVAQRETLTEHLFDTVQWNYDMTDSIHSYVYTYRYANIHMYHTSSRLRLNTYVRYVCHVYTLIHRYRYEVVGLCIPVPYLTY
jgi:hypothetical protein